MAASARYRGREPVQLVMATGVPSHGARQSRGDVPLALGAEPLAYSCDNEEHDDGVAVLFVFFVSPVG